MKMTASLLCFVALLVAVNACAPLTPGVGNNPKFTAEREAKITELRSKITETKAFVETKETEVQKWEYAYTNALNQIQNIKDLLKFDGNVPYLKAELARFTETIDEYKKKSDDLNKARTELNDQRKKLSELEVEKKVFGYGKLSNEAFDQKIEEVTTKLTKVQLDLKTATDDIATKQAELETIKEGNAAAFDYDEKIKISKRVIKDGTEYWKLQAELKKIDRSEDETEYEAKEKEIADLLKRIVQREVIVRSEESFNRWKTVAFPVVEAKLLANYVKTIEGYETKKSELQATKIHAEETEFLISTLEFEKTTLEQQKTTKK